MYRNSKGMVLFIIAFLPFIIASARLDSVNTHYLRVDETDRINMDEAKIIGKKELVNLGQHYYYRLTAPHVIVDKRTLLYPGYWFISFDPKAIGKVKYSNYLVVIEKETGKIVFSSSYDPRKVDDFSWAMHNKKNTPEGNNP